MWPAPCFAAEHRQDQVQLAGGLPAYCAGCSRSSMHVRAQQHAPHSRHLTHRTPLCSACSTPWWAVLDVRSESRRPSGCSHSAWQGHICPPTLAPETSPAVLQTQRALIHIAHMCAGSKPALRDAPTPADRAASRGARRPANRGTLPGPDHERRAPPRVRLLTLLAAHQLVASHICSIAMHAACIHSNRPGFQQSNRSSHPDPGATGAGAPAKYTRTCRNGDQNKK